MRQELLHRWEGGELNVDLTCVIRCASGALRSLLERLIKPAVVARRRRSNHQRDRNSYVTRFLERHGVPLYYVPAGGAAAPGSMRSHEPALLSLTHKSDFIVLARYMQILSGHFLASYGRDVINIHVRTGGCESDACVRLPDALLPCWRDSMAYCRRSRARTRTAKRTRRA